MPITIGSNIASLRTQRQLSSATSALTSTYDRLSSGLRITRAADDAAGLSIAESLKGDSRVYAQALRNINDAVSLLNIAQGATQQLSSIVIRQSELAEQAANGVYSSAQRAAINSEASALSAEYNRIISTTTFNNSQLLNGSNPFIRIQQGFGLAEATTIGVGSEVGRIAGAGTISQSGTGNFLGNSRDAIAVDFDLDGNLDLIQTSFDGSLVIFKGNGDLSFRPSFTAAIGSAVGYVDVKTGDFNGDGFVDLAVGKQSEGNVSILLNNGNGTFRAGVTYNAAPSSAVDGQYLSVGDFNGDGRDDIAFLSSSNISSFISNADGTLRLAQTVTNAGLYSNPEGLQARDLNGDGKLDLFVNNASSGSTLVHLGNGDGSFGTQFGQNLLQSVTATTNYSFATLADFNNDGRLDSIGYRNGSGRFSVSLGVGNGTFQTAVTFAGPDGNYEVGDFNDDGNLDILAISLTERGIAFGRGDGTFSSFVTTADAHALFYTQTSGDFNNDGLQDIIGTTIGGGGYIYSVDADNTRRVNTVTAQDLSSVLGAKEALGYFADRLKKINLEVAAIGAAQSRLSAAAGALVTRKEGYIAAQSSITDVDIAVESASLVRTQILQQAATSVLAQANLQPQISLSLLRNI